MIDKELIHQAAEDIDIFEADLTEEYECLCPKPQHRMLRLWPLAAAACATGIAFILLMPPKTDPSQPHLKGEELFAAEFSPFNGELEVGRGLSVDAQLAYQQEIKEKGERLAAFVQQYTTRDKQ